MPKVREFNIVKNGMVFLFLSVLSLGLLQAQQNVRYKNQNRNELSQFAKLKHAKWMLDKRKADSLANSLSIPIYYVEKDSNKVVILQRLGPKNKPVYYATDNISAAATISVDDVWSVSNEYSSLTGEGIEINLWDGGAVRATHQELQNDLGTRVIMRDLALPLSNHSTHIAGTMIATGVNADAKGMAGKATIKAWDLNDDIAEMSGEAAEGIVVSNHSYGSFCGWMYNSINESWYWYGDPEISATEDYEFGFYNQTSADLDYIAHLAPDYLIVKSAGNDRNESPTSSFVHYVWDETWKLVNVEREPDGGTDGFDCLTPMAVAKNILTVGAVDDAKAMTSFTAYGPTDDGRIKPDVVANGANVISSVSSADNSYGSYNGTSMATASATGSVALLHQLQNTLQPGVQARSSTIKGLLIHTASDLGNTGPDYRFGWGLLNIKEAADLIYTNSHNQGKNIHEEVLENSGEINIPVSTQSAPFLKVTLCWTDPAAQASSPSLNSRNNKLVNDLDVTVENSDNHQTYMPWMLNVENPGVAATQDINHIDNVEQVYIANPGDNKFNIKISHSGSLTGGSQNFSLLISGIETTSNIFPPKNLTYTINESTISLNWDSPDSGAPESYKIYRNGTLLTETVNPTYNDQSIVLDNIYEYYVTALYELNNEKFESLGTNLITVYPQTLRLLPFIVDFENESTEVIIKNNEFGWRWGDSESLNSNFLNFSENTTKFIGIDSYSAGDAVHVSDIAFTTPLRLADYSDIILSFDFLFVTDFYDVINELHVVYKFQEDKEWLELEELNSSYGWKHKSIALPPEMFKNGIQIGFFYDDLGQLGIGAGLDNIQITGTLNIQDDISLQSINSPGNSLCLQENPLNLNIDVNNSGNTSIMAGEILQITTLCNDIESINNHILIHDLNPGESLSIEYQNLINPLPVGTHVLMVEIDWVKDENSSNNSTSKSITVNALPEIIFDNPPEILCENEEVVSIIVNPEGGIFTSDYLNNNTFNPSDAGVGFHEITYAITDVNGCTNSSSIIIEVLSIPEVSFTGLSSQYCIDDPKVLLTGSPVGGLFSGDGINENDFSPKIAGEGNHIIEYTFTDQDGCSNTSQEETIVNETTELTILNLEESYCQDIGPIELSASPAGGIFYVDDIEQNYFSPNQSDAGEIIITYEYLNAYGCSSIASDTIEVSALPQVSIEGIADMYCHIDTGIVLSGSPEGGTFSIEDEQITSFNPIVLGEGDYQLIYEYQDLNSCAASTSQLISIESEPTISMEGLKMSYCPNDEPVDLIGSPEGGYFEIDGNSENTLCPGLLSPGEHIVSYYYEINGCKSFTEFKTYVTEPTNVTIYGLAPSYCLDDSLINVSGQPEGGFFTIHEIVDEIPDSRSYTLYYTFIDDQNCFYMDSGSFKIFPEPEVMLSSNIYLTAIDTTTLLLENNNLFYVWPGDSVSKEIEFIGSLLPVGENVIPLVIQNEFGCSTNFQLTVLIEGPAWIQDQNLQPNVILTPNPADKSVNIQFNDDYITNTNWNIAISDINGKIISNYSLKLLNESFYSIDVQNLKEGIYLISISDLESRYITKIIIQH